MRVHDVIAQEELTLEAYCRAVRTSLWASKVELSLGAEYLGISFVYMDGKQCEILGHGKDHTWHPPHEQALHPSQGAQDWPSGERYTLKEEACMQIGAHGRWKGAHRVPH